MKMISTSVMNLILGFVGKKHFPKMYRVFDLTRFGAFLSLADSGLRYEALRPPVKVKIIARFQTTAHGGELFDFLRLFLQTGPQ